MAEEKRQEPGSKDTLEARIRDLEATVVAQRAAMPMSVTPEHGAGEGMEVEETWSQYDQENAIEDNEPGPAPTR